jgi:hypothetical protein
MSSMPSTAPASAEPQDSLFGRYVERRKPRRWLWLVGVVLVAAASGTLAARREQGTRQVLTAQGVRTVRRGMTTVEVAGAIGKPFASRRDGELRCDLHGQPNYLNPKFVVYSMCYVEDRLRDVTEQYYTAWTVDPEGTPKLGGG